MPALHRDLREFVALLNSNEVDYLVVGAHALAYHGHPRYTGDLDLFVRACEANAQKLERVIVAFGFEDTGLRADDFLTEGAVIQLGIAPNRIDLLTGLTGVLFDEAWEERIEAELDGVPVHMLSKPHLIRNKKALGRPKDLADVDSLNTV